MTKAHDAENKTANRERYKLTRKSQDIVNMTAILVFAVFLLLGGISGLPQSEFVVKFESPSEKSTSKGCLIRKTPRDYPAR